MACVMVVLWIPDRKDTGRAVVSAVRCGASYCTKILAFGPNVVWAAFAVQERSVD